MVKVAQYRRRFAHECDAFARVVGSLETVPEADRSSSEYRRAVSLLAHLTMARGVWLSRLGAGPAPAGKTLFPEDVPLETVVAQWDATSGDWMRYLSDLTDADLDRVVEYASLDAGRFRNRVEDVLTQLDGHAPYHRGQIAMLVRQSGGTPAMTDFIYWAREPVGA